MPKIFCELIVIKQALNSNFKNLITITNYIIKKYLHL